MRGKRNVTNISTHEAHDGAKGDTAPVTFNPSSLPPKVRTKLEYLEGRLTARVLQYGKQTLRIGQTLKRIQDLLAPQRLFGPWLESLPWMPTATAYRYIGAYKQARTRLPVAVLTKVLLSGLPMFSHKEDRPFGRYTAAVESVGKPPSDEAKVNGWLEEVFAAYEKQQNRKKAKLTAEEVEESAKRAILRFYKSCPAGISAARFAETVVQMFLQEMRKAA